MLEGSYALGLAEAEEPKQQQGRGWVAIWSARSRKLLVSWRVAGHDAIEVLRAFQPGDRSPVNLVYPRMAVISLSKRLDDLQAGPITLTSLHYASPKPARMDLIQTQARDLIQRWK